MFRSILRLALIFPLVLFGIGAYAQQGTVAQSATSASQAVQNNTGQNNALPDDPGTTAHVKAPLEPTGPTAVLDTSMGRMTCRLFSKEAPRTVANFVGLATGHKQWTNPATHEKMVGKPLYNGTTFHRVIPNFMIQGGDPLGNGMGGPGYYFDDEVTPDLNFDIAGRLAMANAGPNTNGSQFFITVSPQPDLDQHYSIFGQCDPASVLVAESITEVERDSRDKPFESVYLNKVTIVQPGQPMPPLPAAPPAGTPAQTHP